MSVQPRVLRRVHADTFALACAAMASDTEDDDYTDDALQRDVASLLDVQDDGSGVDASVLARRTALQQAALQKVEDAAVADAVVDFAGPSPNGKALWRIWIKYLFEKRKSDPLQFARNTDWLEDLDPLVGPRDAIRALTNGFERTDDGDIVWEYLDGEAFRSGERQTWKDDMSIDQVYELVQGAANFFNANQRIRPKRIPKNQAELGALRAPVETKVNSDGIEKTYQGGASKIDRDVFGRPIEDPAKLGLPKMVPHMDAVGTKLKYARVRSDKGTRILRDYTGKPVTRARAFKATPVTGSIRLQIMSVRLNAHNWEWIYSRHLKNDQMFDTPSMTPYLHNEEFARAIPGKSKPERLNRMNETGAAIPLLTRGTLGFDGVSLAKGNAEAAKPKLAIMSKADLAQRWTVQSLRGLPRMRFHKGEIPKSLLEAPPVDAVLQDQTPVKCYLVDSQGEVLWNTVFAIDDTEMYANTFYGEANGTYDDLQLGVRGYDSWVEGHGAAAVLASTDANNADARLELAFKGLPLYFASGKEVTKGLTGTPPNKYFEDVRVREAGTSGPGDTGPNKVYSEVYRQLMWAPLPVSSIPTFPSSGSAFRTKSDPQAKAFTIQQLPRYLNFGIETDDRAARPVAEGAPAAQGPSAQFRPTEYPPPMLNKNVHVRLLQQYPEVVLSTREDVRGRIPQANAFLKTLGNPETFKQEAWSADNLPYYDAGRRGDVALRAFAKLKNQEAGGNAGMWTRAKEAWLEALDRDEFAHLAPTTIRGAMARYMAEQANALAYYRMDAEGQNPRKLNTSHVNGLQQPGGLYYSCRIDTDIGERKGGLDTFLPISMEAGVFEIADLGLARGVHDYVYTRPQEAPVVVNPQFATRAGPPHWWQREDEKREQVAPESALRYHEILAGNNVPSIWVSSEATPEVARAIYDELPYILPNAGARRPLFPTDQLRRLDTAEARPEPVNPPSLHAKLALTVKGRFPGKLQSHFTPTKLVLGPALVDSDKNTLQSVMFGTCFPARPDGASREVGQAIVQALPHRHDLRVPCVPFYPMRLSKEARGAVWDRVRRLQESERTNGSPEVGKHFETDAKFYASETDERPTSSTDMPEALPVARTRGYEETRRKMGKGASKTLVTPLYVVALDYDDFQQAVVNCDMEWTEFFNNHKVYLENKDRFMIVKHEGGEHLEVNPTWVRPDDEDLGGDWKTHDGPWGEAVAALGVPVERVELARRPNTRTRASWFADRVRFGGRRPDGTNVGIPVDFESEVIKWEAMHAAYERVSNELSTASVQNTQIRHRIESLHTDSMRLCWSLAKLSSQPTQDAGNLYSIDGEIPQIGEAALREQGMFLPSYLQTGEDISVLSAEELAKHQRLYIHTQFNDNLDCAFHTNQLQELSMRLPLVSMLLNTLDQLNSVREHTQWLAQAHGTLTGDTEARDRNAARLRMRPPVRLEYLDSLCAMPVMEWPTEGRMDDITRRAGATVHALLVTLKNNVVVWSAILERVEAIQRDDNVRYEVTDPHLMAHASSNASIVNTMIDMNEDDAMNLHPLSHAMRPALYLVLDAWAAFIYEGRLAVVRKAMEEWGNPDYFASNVSEELGLTIEQVEQSVKGASPEALKQPLARRYLTDLRSMSQFFGLAKVNDNVVAHPLQYARELVIVGQLLKQQFRFLQDNPSLLFGKRDMLNTTWEDENKDLVLVKTTADAFSRIFLLAKEGPRKTLEDGLVSLLAGGLDDAERARVQEAMGQMRGRVMMLQSQRQLKSLPDLPSDVEPTESIPDLILYAFGVIEGYVDRGQTDLSIQLQQQREERERAYKVRQMQQRHKALIIVAARLSEAHGALRTQEVALSTKRNLLSDTPENQEERTTLSETRERVLTYIETLKTRRKMLFSMYAVVNACLAKGPNATAKLFDALVRIRRAAQRRNARRALPGDDGTPGPVVGDAADGAGSSTDGGLGAVSDLFDDPLQASGLGGEESTIAERARAGARQEIQRAVQRGTATAEDSLATLMAEAEATEEAMTVVGGIRNEADRAIGVQDADELLSAAEDALAGIPEDEMAALRNMLFGAMPPPVFGQGSFDERTRFDESNTSISAPPPSLPPSPPGPAIGRAAPFEIPDALRLPPSLIKDAKDLPKDGDEALDWVTEKMRANDKLEVMKTWLRERAEQLGEEAVAQWDGLIAQLETQHEALGSMARDIEMALRDEEVKLTTLQRAVSVLRTYLQYPELVDPEGHAKEEREQLERLNAELRLIPYTDDGMSAKEYRERLRGIGIEYPEACNDDNIDEIDSRELHGWKGQYRRHVANMIRIRRTADGVYSYHLDALPPTPQQWLESSDARRAPGPPRVPERDPDAEAEAELLQAKSLAQGVQAIVGPEEQWTGRTVSRAEELVHTEKTLKALLLADRAFWTDPQQSLYAPFAFDFDGIEASNVIHA